MIVNLQLIAQLSISKSFEHLVLNYSGTPLYGHPLNTDTRFIRTPALYGQFRLSRQKARIFPLKLTRFIRTPGNTDNGHFSVFRVTKTRFTLEEIVPDS